MDPQETKADQRSNPPAVSIPVHLFHQMSLCFYGEGPRYWELFAPGGAVRNLSPHPPEAPLFPQGAYVPPIPPAWKRVVTEGPDESSTVQTS